MEQQNRHWLCQTYCSLGFGPCGCCFCWLLFLLGLTYRVNGCMSVNGCINGCTTFFWGSSRSTKLKGYKDHIGSAGPQRVNQLESPVRSREGRTDNSSTQNEWRTAQHKLFWHMVVDSVTHSQEKLSNPVRSGAVLEMHRQTARKTVRCGHKS